MWKIWIKFDENIRRVYFLIFLYEITKITFQIDRIIHRYAIKYKSENDLIGWFYDKDKFQ